MKNLASILVLSLTTFVPAVQADVKLHALFSDHAVLLSGAEVPVWGWADAGEKVEVSFANQTKSAMADANGKWMVKLDALKGNAKPQELTVKGKKNTLTVKDVLVGEVWLGSGQSNMAWPVSKAYDFEKEVGAAKFPHVRMFTVRSKTSATAKEDCGGAWSVCSPETVGGFSATLYYFGREIHKTLGFPIDIGEEKNIHPTNKQEVGRRLSLWALGDVYGQKIPSTSGPLPSGHEVKGDKIVLKFTHSDEGLAAKDGDLRSFQIAGEDKQWKPATAQIIGDTVIVHSPEIAKPVAVRYAWKGWPDCNLYNGAGLPASPFRTDEWEN